ncbi:transmembrane protein, putative, partial [Bodo saltans]
MSRPPPTDNDPISEPDLGVYTPKYPNGNRGRLLVEVAPGEGDTDALLAPNQKLRSVVPWGLRTIDRYQSCPAFQFMTTARFWRCVEGAFRTAVIGMLPPAVVLYSTYDNNNGPWKSQSIMLVGAMLGVLGKETIGLQVQYIGTFMRASIIWVPIITIAAAIELYFHMVAIFIVYGVCIFLIGAFTEGFSRRVAMLFLTMVYMDMLRSHPPTEKSRRYFDLWLEILIGTGFACLCAVFPWPALSSHKADEALDTLSSNISIALQGLTSSFWTDSSLTRNVQMVRVRFVMHSIEANIGEVKKHLVGAEHEWMFQSSERRSLRLLKTSLYAKLFRNLSSIRRVVDIVRERPAILSHSERAILFGDRLCKRIDAICVAVDELLYHLNMAKSNDELLKTGIY